MSASTKENDPAAERLGFVSGHQYGVLAAKEYGEQERHMFVM
jgi:hypothetical protein